MLPTPDATMRPHEGNVRLLRQQVVAGALTEQEAEAMLGKSVWEGQGKVPPMWPTPRAGKRDEEDEEKWQQRADKGDVHTPPLGLAVAMDKYNDPASRLWWTPSAALAFRDFVLTPEVAHREQSGGNLHRQVAQELFPTPDASPHKFRLQGNSQQSRSLEAKARRGELDNCVMPTPTASDHRSIARNPNAPSTIRDYNRHKLHATVVHQEQRVGQRLHAAWVNRMMGLPDGWLDSTPAPLVDPRWEGNPLRAFGPWWEDGVPRVVEQEDERVHKLKALGNGIVPQVAFVLLTCMDEAGWA